MTSPFHVMTTHSGGCVHLMIFNSVIITVYVIWLLYFSGATLLPGMKIVCKAVQCDVPCDVKMVLPLVAKNDPNCVWPFSLQLHACIWRTDRRRAMYRVACIGWLY